MKIRFTTSHFREPYDYDVPLVGVRVAREALDGLWKYCGTFALPSELWEKLRGVIEVGGEDNPLGLDILFEKED